MLQKTRTLLMVPGYNEPPEHFNQLAKGNGTLGGLSDFGFECVIFGQQNDTLGERIDRFATFVDEARASGLPFPVVLLGYSLGGLVVRGFLRRYPHRASEVSHTITISTPNWGVVTLAIPHITRLLRMPDRAFADMDLNSEFMQWLNGTSGHWEYVRDPRYRLWVLDGEPWIAPPNAKILAIMGLVPSRGYDNDGLVWADSATLGSRIPAHYVVGPTANHMNVIGHFDPVVMVTKGFLANDRVWPLVLRAILRFVEAQPMAGVEPLEVP